jgi:hypothetical protein
MMRVLIVILMFFVVGALIIITNNNLVLVQEGNFGIFFDLYLGWLNKIFINSQIITGNVVGLDWKPQ